MPCGRAGRQALSPHMDLQQIMLLAGTCRAWRQLITLTPVHELSAEARRAVLLCGLSTSLPLLQLLQQQAQLLARITDQHSDPLQIQHLSFQPWIPCSGSRTWNGHHVSALRMQAATLCSVVRTGLCPS